jgi:hypothetical protein
MCITFHVFSLLPGLGRTLKSLCMLSFAEFGVNHGNWLTFCRSCKSRGSQQDDVDDGAGMHEYLLCTISDCDSAC